MKLVTFNKSIYTQSGVIDLFIRSRSCLESETGAVIKQYEWIAMYTVLIKKKKNLIKKLKINEEDA